jgi:hypothetical protein
MSLSGASGYNGRWNQWTEWNDPACAVINVAGNPDNGFYLLKPDGGEVATEMLYHFPRMSQRAWRLVLWPGGKAKPNVAPGWGVGDWSAGGYIGNKLRVWPGMFDHVTPQSLVDQANILSNDLGAMVNSESPATTLFTTQIHLPAIQQKYGGPTGSDDKYKPYPGIKALGLNERAGLLEHMILEMRHMSRSWTVMYEPSGVVVNPLLHLGDAATLRADWQISGAGGSIFAQSSVDQYGPASDAGFGYYSVANRVIRQRNRWLPQQGLQQQSVDRGDRKSVV